MKARRAVGCRTSTALVERFNLSWFSGSLTADPLRHAQNSHGLLVILTVRRAMRVRPIHIPPMTPTQTEQLDRLYCTTKVPRLQTWTQMILLAAEQGLKVAQIALIVRESEATVLRW